MYFVVVNTLIIYTVKINLFYFCLTFETNEKFI